MSDSYEQPAGGLPAHLRDSVMDRVFGVQSGADQAEAGAQDGVQAEIMAAVDQAANRQAIPGLPAEAAGGWTVNGATVGVGNWSGQVADGGYAPESDRRGGAATHSGIREWWSGVPLKVKAGAAAALATVGLTVAVVETTGGSSSVSIEQAAVPPPFNYDTAAHHSKAEATKIQKYEREAHQLLEAYRPFVERAASDPRAGNADALPDHADVRIVYMALLTSATPDAPQGPIVWQGYDKLIKQVNDAAAAKNISLQPLEVSPATTKQSIEDNVIATFFALRKSWPVYAAQNPGKTVDDFAALFFSGGKNGRQNERLARQESVGWYNPSGVNPAFQKIVTQRTSYDVNVLEQALRTMRRYGFAPDTGQGNQQR